MVLGRKGTEVAPRINKVLRGKIEKGIPKQEGSIDQGTGAPEALACWAQRCRGRINATWARVGDEAGKVGRTASF